MPVWLNSMQCRFRAERPATDRNYRLRFGPLIALIVCGLLFSLNAGADDAGDDLALISLTINEQTSREAVLALRDSSGHWWLPVAALKLANVAVPEAPLRQVNGTDYVQVASLPLSALRFDEASQALKLHLLASGFEATRVRSRTRDASIAARSTGAFLNYDLLVDHTPSGVGHSVYAQLGAGLGSGVGITDHWLVDRPDLEKSLRLDSSYTIDHVETMQTLRIGDAITRAPTLLGRPVRFGGLQWGTNFQTRPDLVTVPIATLSGQSALPSTADLYVNNVLQSRNPLPPGPFSISAAPMVTGDGEVLLKLTDLSGQEQLISQRFYSSSALLAAGLSAYSFEVGALRKNFGMRSNDYGDALASASWRHGFSDRLTLEAGASLQQGGPSGLLAGVANALPGLGVATAAIGISHSDAGQGMQFAVGFERRTKLHSYSLRSQIASLDYRQTGVDAEQTLRRLDSLFYGYQISGIGSLGLSWTRQQRLFAEPLSIATASFSTLQTRWGSLVLSVAHLNAERSNTSVNLFWIMRLGPAISASAYHAQSSSGPTQQVIQLQKSLPPAEGWGYRLQLAHNAAQQASLYAQNAYGLARVEAAELNGQTSARIGLTGAVATLDGQWFLSRRIDSSFGVARLPGYANVRIYVDNQLAARTNVEGYALLPRLYPYMKNHVSVEQLDLPLDAQIDSLKTYPVPAWRSGVLVDLPVRRVFAATLNLMREDGTPVPAGASVTLVDESGIEGEPFGVGREGLVYLSGLKQDNRAVAKWPTGQCSVRIPYQPEQGSIPYLGQYPCLGVEVKP